MYTIKNRSDMDLRKTVVLFIFRMILVKNDIYDDAKMLINNNKHDKMLLMMLFYTNKSNIYVEFDSFFCALLLHFI